MDVDLVLSPPVDAVTDGARRTRGARRAKRQLDTEEIKADAGERGPVSRTEQEASRAVDGEEEESAAGSAYNPENPYHVSGNFLINPISKKKTKQNKNMSPALVNCWITIRLCLSE